MSSTGCAPIVLMFFTNMLALFAKKSKNHRSREAALL